MRLLLIPADHHFGFAKIRLRVARGVVQRHEHLTTTPLLLANVILHDRVAAREPVLVTQPIEYPLRRVALLTRLANIIHQPLLDDRRIPVQLRSLDRCRPPITRRNRKTQHLPHALARNPKMTRQRMPAHAVPVPETDLPIQFHGENTPALPDPRKGQSGRLLRRPHRDYPGATVAIFCTAVLKPHGRLRILLDDG